MQVAKIQKCLNSERNFLSMIMSLYMVMAAKASVDSLDAGVVSYKIKHGKLPSDLKELVSGDEPIIKGGDGVLSDPWGEEYKLEKKGKKFAVVCAGPDGEFGNEDDIRSDKVDKKVQK